MAPRPTKKSPGSTTPQPPPRPDLPVQARHPPPPGLPATAPRPTAVVGRVAELMGGKGWGIRTVDGVRRRWFQVGMTPPPDLSRLTEAEKDALILALWTRVAELEARLDAPPKTPGNSSLPPSKGRKADRPEKARPPGPRRGSLGRGGGRRPLARGARP